MPNMHWSAFRLSIGLLVVSHPVSAVHQRNEGTAVLTSDGLDPKLLTPVDYENSPEKVPSIIDLPEIKARLGTFLSDFKKSPDKFPPNGSFKPSDLVPPADPNAPAVAPKALRATEPVEVKPKEEPVQIKSEEVEAKRPSEGIEAEVPESENYLRAESAMEDPVVDIHQLRGLELDPDYANHVREELGLSRVGPPEPSSEDKRLVFGLVSEDCDLHLHGPEYCGVDDTATALLVKLLSRRIMVLLVVMMLVMWVVMAIQYGIRKLVQRLLQTADPFMKDLIETVFRQITVITLASALIKSISTFDIFQKNLDSHIFGQIYNEIDQREGGKVFRVEIIEATIIGFNTKVDNFLLVYVAFAILFVAIAQYDFRWLRKADALTTTEVYQKNPSSSYLGFAVAKFEYMERILPRVLPGLDPQSRWFPEYFRACLLSTCMDLLRIPNLTLGIFSVLIFAAYPVHALYGSKFLIAFGAFNVGVTLILLLTLFWTKRIQRKMLPSDPMTYISIQYQLCYEQVHTDELKYHLEQTGPRYLQNDEPEPKQGSEWFIQALYGTRWPCKQEALFFFWKKGPDVLLRIAEACFLCTMMSAAYIMDSFDKQGSLWFYHYGRVLPALGAVAVITISVAVLPSLIRAVTYVSSTGQLVRDEILTDVLVSCRSHFVKRLSYFVDAIRCLATLRSIKLNKERWEKMVDKVSVQLSQSSRDHRYLLYDAVTKDCEKGITPPVLLEFLSIQGLNIVDEKSLAPWFDLFGGTDGRIHLDRFDELLMAVNEVMEHELDYERMNRLMIDEWALTSEDIGVKEMKFILKRLRLDRRVKSAPNARGSSGWNDSQILHFIQYLSQDMNCRVIPRERFIQAIIEVEKSTLGNLNSIVYRLKQTEQEKYAASVQPNPVMETTWIQEEGESSSYKPSTDSRRSQEEYFNYEQQDRNDGGASGENDRVGRRPA